VKSGERYIGLRVSATRVRINDKGKCGEEKSRWIRCTHDNQEVEDARKKERERERETEERESKEIRLGYIANYVERE